jgi:DnaJ-class molecular chaperone
MSFNPYEIIGVETDATIQAISKAYRTKALQCHPDHNPDPQQIEKFRDLTEAKNILTDVELREVYDRYGIYGVNRLRKSREQQQSDMKICPACEVSVNVEWSKINEDIEVSFPRFSDGSEEQKTVTIPASELTLFHWGNTIVLKHKGYEDPDMIIGDLVVSLKLSHDNIELRFDNGCNYYVSVALSLMSLESFEIFVPNPHGGWYRLVYPNGYEPADDSFFMRRVYPGFGLSKESNMFINIFPDWLEIKKDLSTMTYTKRDKIGYTPQVTDAEIVDESKCRNEENESETQCRAM